MLKNFTPFMKKIGLIILILLSGSMLRAQSPDSTSHKQMAETIKNLYNKKQFKEIYALGSPYFLQMIPEKEFVDFLNHSIYSSLSTMERQRYVGEEKEFHAFITDFKNGQLRMNLLLDENAKLSYFQFLPYEEKKVTKVLDFISDNKKQTELDSLVDASVLKFIQSPQNCGISIGILHQGKRYFYNYGETSRGSKTLANNQTIYEIGSVTKTFCGILLAMAVNEKKMDLEADIRNYLPDKYPHLVVNNSFVKIKHLANHTSGLPRLPESLMTGPEFDSLNPYKSFTRKRMLEDLKKVRPASEPGTVCEYSNYGVALLGLILEDVYKKTFEELVKEKICSPNGMNNTAVILSPRQTEMFAQGYNENGEKTPHWELNAFGAAGALRSTTEDLLNYLNYNLTEPDEATKLAHQATFKGKQTLGLSWFLSNTKADNSLIWHNGGTYGFSSFCGFIKEKKCSVVILSNSATNVDYIAIAIFNYLQKKE